MARLLIPAVCLALLLIACSKDKTEAPDTTVDPATLLQRAAAAVQDAGTFHFKLTHENGTTPIPLNLHSAAQTATSGCPTSSLRTSGEGAGGINVSVKVIAIATRPGSPTRSRALAKLPGAASVTSPTPSACYTLLQASTTQPCRRRN